MLNLSDNYISAIEGLENLKKLRELNLARNDIMHIGDALAANTDLQVLSHDKHAWLWCVWCYEMDMSPGE